MSRLGYLLNSLFPGSAADPLLVGSILDLVSIHIILLYIDNHAAIGTTVNFLEYPNEEKLMDQLQLAGY